MVGARAVYSQIAAEAGPVGAGPFFLFSFEKKIILCFFLWSGSERAPKRRKLTGASLTGRTSS